MLEALSLAPGDRILFLSIPEPALVREASAALPRGLLAAIGERDQVYEARRGSASLENVMFSPATADEIPWQEGFFSWIIETAGDWKLDPVSAREICRVLAPGGQAWLANLDVSPLLELGLISVSAGPDYRLLRKPAAPESSRPNGQNASLR